MTEPSSLVYSPLDLHAWERKQHFELYKNFTNPYFNVCIRLKAWPLYEYCKNNNLSFFLAYVYLAHITASEYRPMSLRIENDHPVHCHKPRVSVVQLAADETFRFSYLQLTQSFSEYRYHHQEQSERSLNDPLFSDAFARTEGQCDLIHVSVLPWLNFSSFSHASSIGASNGIPKLVFGQYDKESTCMPLSIDVHHALVDGLHVARFVQLLQEKFLNPDKYLA
ncbi:CatA-like O-acetyltransferase [Pseudoalteromonas sp. SSDWG2]|uniref:CatA-like O-acetyltransferase n=1 Tax=Pseudoalteromonas sp. SSDWG2 TaxID=3139391 RepID=UPI003BAB4ABB